MLNPELQIIVRLIWDIEPSENTFKDHEDETVGITLSRWSYNYFYLFFYYW